MDRFREETYNRSAAAAHAAKVWGDNPLFSAAVNVCENCGQSCETLVHVPEFNFMGCDGCYDEAMIEAAKDALPARKPARMQADLFSEVA